jgi:hypothetical protein
MTSLTLREFEDINAYSNKNIEKVIESTVNTSSNAVFISMFEGSVILLDHEQGIFYIAECDFDSKKLRVTFDNFEQIELIREEDDFRDEVKDFFEDEDYSISDLTESYKTSVMTQDKYLNDLIQNSMMKKDTMDYVDYGSIKEALEEENISIKDESYFKFYKERLLTHPLKEAQYFNWEDTVSVSLVDTEPQLMVNENAVERAKDLWKEENFKERFKEACEVFVDDVEEGTELLKAVFEDYPQVYFLDNADRKTLFGKSILGIKELRENTNDLMKGLGLLFEKFDLAELRETYLLEAEDEDEIKAETEDDNEDEDEEKEAKAKELTPEQLQKIADELKKISEKLEGETEKKKLDDIISKLEMGKEEGTKPEDVKEAVAILSL